jgi:hypothetical protein
VVGWIVLAVVLLSLVILVAAVRTVLVRLPRLLRAALSLKRYADRAEALKRSALALQERAAAVQQQAQHAQERLATIQARRSS